MDKAEFDEKVNIMNIQNFLNLEKKGRNYVCQCPFHSEKTSSFVVSPEKNIWKCFGCGQGGDYIDFIKVKDGITRTEAYRKVLGFNEKPREEKPINIIYNYLQQYYEAYLNRTNEGDKALKYLYARGFTKEEIDFFKLGYVGGHTKEILEEYEKQNNIGLLIFEAKCHGVLNDRGNNPLLNRLSFPVMDVNKNILGYTARKLTEDDDMPKYLNSQESEDFKKRECFFNLQNAIPFIRQYKNAIIVEGPFDSMSYYVSNIKNVVSTLGCALSREALMEIKKYTNDITLAYDNDEAGRNSILKAWLLAKEMGFKVSVIVLQGAKDANEFMVKYGRENLAKLAKNKINIYGFIRKYIKVEKKETIFKCLAYETSFDQQILIPKISKVLGVSVEAFKEEFANFKTHDLAYWFKCLTYHLLKDINKVRMTNKLIHPKLLSANQKKLLQRIADNDKKDIEFIQNEYNYIDCITNFIKESYKEMN